MADSFETTYPHIADWVKFYGWIQIGRDYDSDPFVQVLNDGGLVWKGRQSYKTLDEAWQALEKALAKWTTQNE